MESRIGQSGKSKIADILKHKHVAEIVRINDPKHLGRIKVDIKGVFSTVDNKETVDFDKSPWIYPETPHQNTFHTPKLKEKVIVWFDGDINHGRYRSYDEIKKDLLDLLKEDYEGFKSVIRDEEEELEISYSRKRGVVMKLDVNTVRIFKDKNKILLSLNDDTNVVEIEDDFVRANFNKGQRVVEINKEGVSTVSDKIFHGSLNKAKEPCVMGEVNENQLNAIWDAINKINEDNKSFHEAQSKITNAIGILKPLFPAHVKAKTNATTNISKDKKIKAKVPETLSKVNRLD